MSKAEMSFFDVSITFWKTTKVVLITWQTQKFGCNGITDLVASAIKLVLPVLQVTTLYYDTPLNRGRFRIEFRGGLSTVGAHWHFNAWFLVIARIKGLKFINAKHGADI